MVTTVYHTEIFTVTSGATGSFYFPTQAGAGGVEFAPEGGNAYGSFNGQDVVGFSTFGNPINATGEPDATAPISQADPYVGTQGIVEYAAEGVVYQGSDGLSLKLADGSSVHIYVVDDGAGGYSLAYETSDSDGGPITLSYHRDVQVFGCFVAGTRIATPGGDTAVETLRPGDPVTVAAGAERPVRWLGHSVGCPMRHPRPEEVMPVRIAAGAFGPSVPARNLRVSPGHALLVGTTLITAGELVNDATIVQEEVELVHYYHVELDSHDLLIAEGMPGESYLDDGNRASFIDGAGHVRLHGRIDPADVEPRCLPLVADGPPLAAARAMLLARAEELGWRRQERAELRIEVDGARLHPVATAGRRHWFVLPEEHRGAVRLRSSSAMPSRIEPGNADGRRLGVVIAELRIDGEPCDLGGPRFGAGFYPPEDDGHTRWRWTDGNASLTIGGAARIIEVKLQIVMPVYRRDPPADLVGPRAAFG